MKRYLTPHWQWVHAPDGVKARTEGSQGPRSGGLCQQYPQFRGEVLHISKFCGELREEAAEKRKTGSDCLIRRQPVWGYEVLEMCAIDHCR
jgi:hypothetical protein